MFVVFSAVALVLDLTLHDSNIFFCIFSSSQQCQAPQKQTLFITSAFACLIVWFPEAVVKYWLNNKHPNWIPLKKKKKLCACFSPSHKWKHQLLNTRLQYELHPVKELLCFSQSSCCGRCIKGFPKMRWGGVQGSLLVFLFSQCVETGC